MIRAWLELGNVLKHEIQQQYLNLYFVIPKKSKVSINHPISSCLPSWSNESIFGVIYIWYVCIVGGLIPSIAIISANMLIMHHLKKVGFLHRYEESLKESE